MDTDDIVTRLRDRLAPLPDDLVAVYLFGSVARGTARPTSDVDVAVLYAATQPATLASLGFDLAADLEPALGRRVDLVVMNRAPADLVHRVLRDGVVVAERDRSRRIAFEVKARNEYFDLAPIRARYRRAGGQAVTDLDLVAKQLALIETYLRELREFANPAAPPSDLRERRFIEHTLQIAVAAVRARLAAR